MIWVIIMAKTYEWTRFWCPNDKKPIISTEGYLEDPEYDFSPNSHLIINPIKLKKNCIILLGEPGIGKTIALKKFTQAFDSEEDEILIVNLSSIGNANHFNDMIFNHAKFQDWRTGDYNLYLLLDSFDECFLHEGVIANLLVEYLKDIPKDRLYLRIACRAGYWPNSLNDNLINIFSEKNFLSYTLVPLRKIDIEELANYEVEGTENTSPSDFMEKIETMGVGLFASIPITLKAFVHEYNQKGYLSRSKTDLYQFYCHYLCGEVNEMRRDARVGLAFTPEQKYIVAARIAALCAFSGKYSIWMSPQIEGMTDEFIHESILRQGQENVLGQSFDVTEICISETLACGLFESSRPVRRWAHWSFLEFLTADYIKKKEIPIVQIMSIIKNSYDGKIIPQLREVVAWLCSFNQDLCDIIIKSEPEVLLQSDLKLFSNDKKEDIVKRLLHNYESSSLKIRLFDLTSLYKKLNHPNISHQIQEYIANSENPRDTKLFAIKIAEKCNLLSLIPVLMGLVLDDDEDMQIRIFAAHALETLSDTQNIEEIERLKTLALSDENLGDDYDLKGISLIILWPNHIKFNELIEHLPDAISGYGGAYMRFFLQHFTENLPNSEIISALKWIGENPKMFMPLAKPCFDAILEQILLKSLELIDNNGVIDELSQTLSALIQDGSYLRERWGKNHFKLVLNKAQELRRIILKRVLIILPFDQRLLIPLFSHLWYNAQKSLFELIHQEDLNWLIQEVTNTEDDEYKEKLALIIYRLILMEPERYNIAYNLKDIPVFHHYFMPWFGPIKYESELASKMREDYKREQLTDEQIKNLRTSSSPAPIGPPLQERIRDLLDRIERGNINYWVILNREMMSENARVDNQSIFNPNLTSLPGWRLSSEEIQYRILSAAKNFIIKGEPNNQEWVGTDKISFHAYAGYRALRLILEMEPDWIGNLTSEIWQKWIPIILLYIFGIYGERIYNPEEVQLIYDDKNLQINPEIIFRNKILQMGYPQARDQFVATLLAQIDYVNEQSDPLTILSRIEIVYDNFIGKALQDKLEEEKLKPEIVGEILEFLLSHNYEKIDEYADRLLKYHSSQNENERLKSIQAAKILLKISPQNSWESIKTIIQDNNEWGREVLKIVASDAQFNKGMFENYTEDQLADLYLLVFRHFPRDLDKLITGRPKFFQSDDFISFWRDNIINYLEIRGTSDSVKALQKIIKNLPEIRESITYRIIRAQEFTRMKSWSPPKPQEIYDLFQNSRTRLIQSGEHFLDVIIESLERLENRLQGRQGYTPAAINLWDHRGKRQFRPKYEEDLSDYIKNHFIDDFRDIIIHREVEIDPGSSPDLFLNVLNRGESTTQNEIISAVVEVKGSWHPKLTTAMQNQLLDQYMKPRNLQYGLFLVGWFRSQYWDDDDTRKDANVSEFDSIDDLKNYLDIQAKELSSEGYVIKNLVIDLSLNEIHLNRYRMT